MFSLQERQSVSGPSAQWTADVWSNLRSPMSHFQVSPLPRMAPEQMLAVAAAQACITMISNQIAAAPIFLESTDDEGVVTREPAPSWLEQPDPDNTCCDVVTQLMTSLLTAGNAYAYITMRDGFFRPRGVKVLHPTQVSVERKGDGPMRYRVNGELVRTEDMVHVRGLMFGGTDVGIGPISYGARLMGMANAQEGYAGARFDSSENGAAIPAYFIGTDQAVSEDQAKGVVRGVRQVAAGSATAPVVLPLGMKPMRVELTAEELELIVSRKFTDNQICSMMNMPPYLVGVPSENTMTYSNVRDNMLALVVFTLKPWARRLSAGLAPLAPPGKSLRFDLMSLTKDLAATTTMTVDANAMTATMQQGDDR